MTSKIRRLSLRTINQIAAGEVIESPASLVKELVENAVDAGAKKIVVETLGGGLQMVRVLDDGCGMGPEDALLCLERHATSKIREAEDLVTVATMGFRGEALSSIASISRMSLKTSLEEGVGTEVVIEGGEVVRVGPCARTRGTTVEVRDLFYNVPARRKFQKAQSALVAEMTKTMSALSLSYPLVSFFLYQQGEEVLHLPSEDVEFLEALKRRSRALLGEEFLQESFLVDIRTSLFSLRGVLGSFKSTRPSRSLQYQFVNERSVLCPAVSFAVKDAFGTRIETSRFPTYVLHLNLPKEYVDVNVHPQKREIRLREEKWIKETIEKEIAKLFVEERKEEEVDPWPLFPQKAPYTYEERDLFIALPSPPPLAMQMEIPLVVRPRLIGLYGQFLWVEAKSLPALDLPKEGLVFVDLNAAASRVLFESLKGQKEQRSQQLLLLPLTLGGSLAEMNELEERIEELEVMGFTLRRDRHCFLVEAIPASLEEQEAIDFLHSFASSEERGLSLEQRRERSLAKAASHVAAKRAEPHTLQSAEALLSALLQTKSPKVCPLGRTILTGVSDDDLQQLFIRKGK